MKRCLLITVIAFGLFFTAGRDVNGQNGIDGFSINPKAGLCIGIGNSYYGGIAGGELNVIKNRFMLSVDFFSSKEISIFFETMESYHQAGIMFGRYEGNKLLRFQYQAGVAPSWALKEAIMLKPASYRDII